MRGAKHASLRLLCGLGNPGREYAANRHNAGFMALDRIAADHGACTPQKRFGGELREGVVAGRKCYFFKPLGYMNASGAPLAQVAHFYKIPPQEIGVFYDELDLPLGKLRVKQGGGHGGHNGLKSIDSHLGKDYWRVRIGIGHPGHRDAVTGHVLSDFGQEETPVICAMVGEISRHIGLLAAGDAAGFMNKIALAFYEPRCAKQETPT